MKTLPLLAILAIVLAAACTSGDGGSSTTSTTSSSTSTTTTTLAGAQLSDLSLVYIDSRKPGVSELWTASYNGAQPKMLTSLQAGANPLDLKGTQLLVSTTAGARYMVADLKTGQLRSVTPDTTATDARLLNTNTLLYTTRGSCAGGPSSSLISVDLTSMQQKTLFTIDRQGMSIVALDAATGVIAVAPRGCDVTTFDTRLYRLSDGSLQQTIATPGCGWATGQLSPLKVLASWKSCNPPAEHATADATLYDLSGINPAVAVAKDLKAPTGGSNSSVWLLRPGKAEAALGTTNGATGPATMSGGLWLLDLNTQVFSPLQPAAGAEQSPVAWSADGLFLLTMQVQAQGVCSYSYTDMTAKTVAAVNSEITMCGVNGQVIGWANLK